MTTTKDRKSSEDLAVAAALAGAMGLGAAAHFGSADVKVWEGPARSALEPLVRENGSWGAWLAGAMSASAGRRVMESLILRGRARFENAAARARATAARVGEWLKTMAAGVFVNHTAAAMAALGRRDLDDADRLVVAGKISEQTTYLRRYRWQVLTGQADPEPARSSLYADAVWATGLAVWLASRVRDGAVLARRVLGAADHCNGCLAAAAMGWVPPHRVVPIGGTECRSRCHCRIETR